MSGYSVIAVTSSSHTVKVAKSQGAKHVFGADETDIVTKIREIDPNLSYAFDAVVAQGTTQNAVDCLSISGLGKLATAIAYSGEILWENVDYSPAFSGNIFGKDIRGQDMPQGLEVGKWVWSSLPSWLKERRVVPLDYEIIGGLDKIPNELNRIRDAKTKGKLVAII